MHGPRVVINKENLTQLIDHESEKPVKGNSFKSEQANESHFIA